MPNCHLVAQWAALLCNSYATWVRVRLTLLVAVSSKVKCQSLLIMAVELEEVEYLNS